jgi:capsular polysaccharide biosynthesis protein
MIHLFKDKCDIYKQLFEKDENGREISIYKLNNCFATGLSLYYPNVLLQEKNNLVLPLLERTMSLGTGTIYERSGMTFTPKKNNDTKTIENTPLFFFIYNTDNYFHFLYDTLPYLISYMVLKKTIPDLKLLMQYPNEQRRTFYPFVLELLELIDIHKDDIILVNSNTIYNEVYISTSYTHDFDSNLPPRKEIYDFYKLFVEKVTQKHAQSQSQGQEQGQEQAQEQAQAQKETPEKIYVSRRTWLHNDFNNIGTNYTMKRRMVNEDEYVDYLVQNGYTEVFTEKLTTIEKILYFSNATHVIGAIGGGISNVLFSPKTTKLEAIVSPTFLDVNKRFKYSLDCVDIYYNMNTSHVETDIYKMYMRVKTKDIIGEIEKIDGENIIVSYTDGTNTGWNSQCKYKQMTLSKNEVERLDNGLNSLWKLDFLFITI